MIIVPTPPPPSPRAMELGMKVADLIRIYKKEYTDLSLTEVSQAMRVAEKEARPEFGGMGASTQAVLVGLICFALLLTGLLFFFKQSGGELPPYLLMAVIGAMIFAGLAVVVFKRR